MIYYIHVIKLRSTRVGGVETGVRLQTPGVWPNCPRVRLESNSPNTNVGFRDIGQYGED
jgi:hypothetical protein